MSKMEATKAVEEVKTEAAKTEGPVSTEAAENAAPKRRGRKPKTETAEKKKPGRAAKKEKDAAPEKTGTVAHLQYGGKDIDLAKIEDNIKAKFVEEGHRAGNIKSLAIYIKPEENKAWYVINDGKFDGNVDLF